VTQQYHQRLAYAIVGVGEAFSIIEKKKKEEKKKKRRGTRVE